MTLELTLTPTQRRIYDRLSDGGYHNRADLMKLLDDDLAGEGQPPKSYFNALQFHIYHIRKIIRPEGYDVVCCIGVRGRTPHYRLVKSVSEESSMLAAPTD